MPGRWTPSRALPLLEPQPFARTDGAAADGAAAEPLSRSPQRGRRGGGRCGGRATEPQPLAWRARRPSRSLRLGAESGSAHRATTQAASASARKNRMQFIVRHACCVRLLCWACREARSTLALTATVRAEI